MHNYLGVETPPEASVEDLIKTHEFISDINQLVEEGKLELYEDKDGEPAVRAI